MARHVYVWEFEIEARCRAEFLRHYGPDGTWVQLFRQAPGYLGTLLLQDQQSPERYLTIDRWASSEAHDRFVRRSGDEYRRIDRLCEPLTVSERSVGAYWEDVAGQACSDAPSVSYRRAAAEDALCLSVLATQVFLDTYATEGIHPDLAREVTSVLSVDAFQARLRRETVELVVAEQGGCSIGLMDLDFASTCPSPGIDGLEVYRLYVQQPFQRQRVGRALMGLAEQRARSGGRQHVWLAAWVGNQRARAFYEALGYDDIGSTSYIIEGRAYENRVLAKQLRADPVGR